METPLSLRIWSPDDYGQSCQVKINWDDSRPYYASFDPNLFGNPLVYNVECRDGYETYRCILNNFVYSTNPSCPVVELRIPSGYVIVRQSDKSVPVSPGVLLREVIAHLVDSYMKERFGKIKYVDEKHIFFDPAPIQSFLDVYTAIPTWGRRLQMTGVKKPINIQASSNKEIDRALLTIPTASSLVEYSEVYLADFINGGDINAESVKSDPDWTRIFVRCQRVDGATIDRELGEVPIHLRLNDFGLDSEIYQDVEAVIDKTKVLENFRYDKYEFYIASGLKVTVYPFMQRLVVTCDPIERSQTFCYSVVVQGPGEVTPKLIKSVLFRDEALKGNLIAASGWRLKKFIHSSPEELKVLFSLPASSEYYVENVEIRGDTISICVKMRPAYAEIFRRRIKQPTAQKGDSQESIKFYGDHGNEPTMHILDVHCPISAKKKTVDARIILSGRGCRTLKHFTANIEDGRIFQEVFMSPLDKASIALCSPAKYTSRLVQEKRSGSDVYALRVLSWHKVNYIQRFAKSFNFFYDDCSTYYFRISIISLGVLLLLSIGFYLGFKWASEDSQRYNQTPSSELNIPTRPPIEQSIVEEVARPHNANETQNPMVKSGR